MVWSPEQARKERFEQLRKDSETRKKRRLTVTLTDMQYQDLIEKALEHKVTVDQILSNYVADLTQIHSNGSDERMYAEQYFERTWLSWANIREDVE